jgi:hypothetical protein
VAGRSGEESQFHYSFFGWASSLLHYYLVSRFRTAHDKAIIIKEL